MQNTCLFLENIIVCWKPREREHSTSIYCKCNASPYLEKKSSFLVYPGHMNSLESVRVDELKLGAIEDHCVSSLRKLYLLKALRGEPF